MNHAIITGKNFTTRHFWYRSHLSPRVHQIFLLRAVTCVLYWSYAQTQRIVRFMNGTLSIHQFLRCGKSHRFWFYFNKCWETSLWGYYSILWAQYKLLMKWKSNRINVANSANIISSIRDLFFFFFYDSLKMLLCPVDIIYSRMIVHCKQALNMWIEYW